MKNNTYFNVYIDKDIDEEFQYLLEKEPYVSEEEIGINHLIGIIKRKNSMQHINSFCILA